MRPRFLLSLLAVALLAACRPAGPAATGAIPGNDVTPEIAFQGQMLEPQGFIRLVHDPVIAREGDTYTIFHTGARIPFLCSPDMVTWEFCGRVFERIPPVEIRQRRHAMIERPDAREDDLLRIRNLGRVVDDPGDPSSTLRHTNDGGQIAETEVGNGDLAPGRDLRVPALRCLCIRMHRQPAPRLSPA